MVICIVALVVFSILGIFSARYRGLAKDAFKCVFKMIQFKPCDVQLEQKIKSKVASKLMRIPSLASFFYKNFKIISWIFTIAFFVSLIYSAYGIFNLVVYGTCDPSSPGQCVINQYWSVLTCYEAQVVYAIIIIAVILYLIFYYILKRKNIKIVID
jgi:phosphotransferase system  glucose/maltose/N-acetylglucosamine-specific IIC component